jgi:hypothetical protein
LECRENLFIQIATGQPKLPDSSTYSHDDYSEIWQALDVLQFPPPDIAPVNDGDVDLPVLQV